MCPSVSAHLYRRTLRMESKSSKFLDNERPSKEMLNIICVAFCDLEERGCSVGSKNSFTLWHPSGQIHFLSSVPCEVFWPCRRNCEFETRRNSPPTSPVNHRHDGPGKDWPSSRRKSFWSVSAGHRSGICPGETLGRCRADPPPLVHKWSPADFKKSLLEK